jgi:hypothetical protein
MVAMNDYRGDLAHASFGEAADLRARHHSDDRLAIARVCARAVEVPMRWPGSMKHVPAEEDVRRHLELGLANVGEQDSELHVRLLLARAFVPYAFGTRRAITDAECDQALADGERAADMAMRLGRPDLASASLDGAGTSWWVRGLYGPSVPNIRRRLELADMLEDPWELGDMYAVAAWTYSTIGDYAEAVRLADLGQSAAANQASGMELHNLSWRAFAEFALGNWSFVLDTVLPRVQTVLGDRFADPPYFTAHAYGSAAFIRVARGDPTAATLLALLRRNTEDVQQGEWPSLSLIWLAWIATRQGTWDEVEALLEPVSLSHTELRRPLQDQVTATALAAFGRWDDVPAFLAGSRAFAERAGLLALPAHLDRLDGRASLAAGNAERAATLLDRADAGFAALGASWERAVTELDLADALASAGRDQNARAALAQAAPVLELSGAVIELERLGKARGDPA